MNSGGPSCEQWRALSRGGPSCEHGPPLIPRPRPIYGMTTRACASGGTRDETRAKGRGGESEGGGARRITDGALTCTRAWAGASASASEPTPV